MCTGVITKDGAKEEASPACLEEEMPGLVMPRSDHFSAIFQILFEIRTVILEGLCDAAF